MVVLGTPSLVSSLLRRGQRKGEKQPCRHLREGQPRLRAQRGKGPELGMCLSL